EPTPWEAYVYDANDNAGRTHPDASASYRSHWDTPSSVEVDALGRPVRSVVRAGLAPKDEYVTRTTYDVRGNVLAVVDPLNRVVVRRVYDLLDRPWRVEALDAGARLGVCDAAGNLVEERTARESLQLYARDALGRPVLSWARDGPGEAV